MNSILSRSRKSWSGTYFSCLLTGLMLLGLSTGASAQTCTNIATGTWSTAANWTCTLPAANRVPLATDAVIIINNTTVTVNIAGAVALSVTVNGGANSSGIAYAAVAGNKLTVTNDVTINAPTSNGVTKQIAVVARDLAIGRDLIINGGTVGGTAATRTSQVTVTTGTITVGRHVTLNGGSVVSTTQLTATTGANAITITGNLNLNGGSLANANVLTSVTTGKIAVTGNLNITGGTADTTTTTAQVNGAGTFNITGDVIITGGNGGANTRDALLTTSTGTVTITGNLSLVSTVAGTATASITSTGSIVVNGATGVTNADTVAIAAGTFTVGNAAATFTNSNTTVLADTSISTGLLSIAGNLVNGSTGVNAIADTIRLTAAGTITVGGTLTNNTGATVNGTITNSTTGTINANGNFLNNGVFIHSAAGNLNLRGTTATMNGTFTRTLTTDTVTSNKGTAGAQTLSGTALAFSNFVMNSANGVTLGANATVNTLLTLTSGQITTGANNVIIGTTGTIATPTASSYVVGNFQKNYAASASLNYFAGNNFPVGDATNFTPVNISAGTITAVAGSLTVSTFTPDHPQVTTPIASTGIDATKSVNRYWRFTNSGLTIATAITAKFTFVATDRDNLADTPSYIIERYDGTNWYPTTAGTANVLDTTASNITPLAAGNNDFAIGVPFAGFNSIPGAFNVFEASTPANAILGRIYTKIKGTAITLQVVAVNAGRTGVNTLYSTNPITVDLLDARDNTGAITAATNCRSTWTTVISTQSLSPVWTSGRSATISITAPANAWRDVRVRVTQGGNIGCSTDRFAIRPTAFSSITSTANNSTTGAGTTFKTGQNFTINALTALSGYDNGSGVTLAIPALIPLIDNTSGMVLGSSTQGTIGGAFSAASGGTASGASFYYDEVGNFGLAANAIYDNAFTAIDQPNDCVTTAGLDFSNTADANGKYGCKFGNALIALASGFGRFIPDNFAVSYTAPQFTTACGAGSFSYVGQPFTYGIAPVLTVTARNGTTNGLTNAPTTNYAGAYMKLTNASLTPNTQAARYSRFDALGGGTTPVLDTTTGLPATTADPAIGTFTNGVGDLTFGSGTGLAFTRTTPNAPFNADIALTLNVIDTDGVAYASNPAAFGVATSGNGIAFNIDKKMRYGRLRLSNAYGSELLPLRVPVRTEYSSGTTWTLNTNDACTSVTSTMGVLAYGTSGTPLANGNFRITSTDPNTGLGSTGNWMTASSTSLSGGTGTIILNKPCVGGPGAACTSAVGSADLTLTVPAWLRGTWTSSGNWDQNPSARIRFGAPKAPYIYLRERY
ncbi:MAG: hypothetical protein NTW45_10490 [Rhodocyclales bacterium]|nr:hypothetical protein [Rhodocyclales bacterium]